MNVKHVLSEIDEKSSAFYFNNVEVIPENIKAILINEVVPIDEKDDFYGDVNAAYLSTTLPLFKQAGIDVNSTKEILDLGIYITNAVKKPKNEYTIERDRIEESLPYLEKELSLFPNVKVIMLMGDVAKKAFNMITKKETKKLAIPAISTYKIRSQELYYKNIRIMPSYIMTGKNILIEKSKFKMASEDIACMYDIIKNDF